MAHRILIWIILKQNYNENNHTNDQFKIFKILKISQLYDKLAIIKLNKQRNQFKPNYISTTRNLNTGNLALFKPNTTLIKLFYVYRGIQLFNKLPCYMKTIDNDLKFKFEIKKRFNNLFH